MISVVMSTYNEKEVYLRNSIESILGQTYSNIEFIIINDNPNNIILKKILNEYQLSDQRIVLLNNINNLGLVKSLNKGIAIAKGEYIARMDADDIAIPYRLSYELEYMNKHNLDLVAAPVKYIDSIGLVIEGQVQAPCSPKAMNKIVRFRNCLPHPTWLVKKKVYDLLHGYRLVLYTEDYDFLLRALASGYKIGYCDKYLLEYRVNETGISKTHTFKQYITSRYLSHCFYRGIVPTTDEIFSFVKRACTKESENEFNQIKYKFENLNKNLLIRFWELLLLYAESNFAREYMNIILKEKLIRKFF